MLRIQSAEPCAYDPAIPRRHEVWTHERDIQDPDSSMQFHRNQLQGDPALIARALKLAHGIIVPSMNCVLGALQSFTPDRGRVPLRSLVTATLVQVCEGPHDDETECEPRYEGFKRDVWLFQGGRRRLFELAAEPDLDDQGIGFVTDNQAVRRPAVCVPMTAGEQEAYARVWAAPLWAESDPGLSPLILLHRSAKDTKIQLEQMYEFRDYVGGF